MTLTIVDKFLYPKISFILANFMFLAGISGLLLLS